MKLAGFPICSFLQTVRRTCRRSVFCAVSIAIFPGLFSFAGNLSAQNPTDDAPWEARNVPWATPYYTYEVQSEIVYGQGEINGGGSFKNLTLDLYIPDIPPPVNAVNKLSLMVMIHGGGFSGGSKANADIVRSAQDIAQRGWLVAAINYRLMDDNPIPSSRVQALYAAFGGANAPLQIRTAVAAVDDTLTALDFLQTRGDVYKPWTTLWGVSAGAYTSLITAYCLDDYGITRPPVAAVVNVAGGLGNCSIGTPFDDPTGSDPVLMVVHGTSDPTVPYSEAVAIQNWAISAGLPLDFQAVTGAGHVPSLYDYNAVQGVTLFQRSVDFHHETVFAGLNQGPQLPLPPGC
ncbi:MAG: hypothetical protein R3E50_09465 [Halioglobus sp.]